VSTLRRPILSNFRAVGALPGYNARMGPDHSLAGAVASFLAAKGIADQAALSHELLVR
jgi:hypothetical protein